MTLGLSSGFMRLFGLSSSLLATALLGACAPAPHVGAPPVPSAAPASSETNAAAASASVPSSAPALAGPAEPAPLVLPKGLFLVAEAPSDDRVTVFPAANGDAVVVTLQTGSLRTRGAVVHGDAITNAPIVEDLASRLPPSAKTGALAELALLADGGAIARWDGGDTGSRCHVLRRGPAAASWQAVGAAPAQGDQCGPVAAWGAGAIIASSPRVGGPASLLPFGDVPQPLERRLAPAGPKAKKCGVWTTSVLATAAFPSGEAITVGVPCEAPALMIERFAAGAKTSQTATFGDLMIDYPTTIDIVSPTRIALHRTIGNHAGETALLDVQLDFAKGAWKETSRVAAGPRPQAPNDKLTDQRYVTGESWVAGDDVYVLFRPKDTGSKLPQIVARTRAVTSPIDLRESAPAADGAPPRAPRLGGDRDAHGCIGSAGYSWSELRKSCVRLFEVGLRLTPFPTPSGAEGVSQNRLGPGPQRGDLEAAMSAFLVFAGNDQTPAHNPSVELFVPGVRPSTLLERDKKGGRYVGGVFAATFAKKWSVEKDGKPAYTSGP